MRRLQTIWPGARSRRRMPIRFEASFDKCRVNILADIADHALPALITDKCRLADAVCGRTAKKFHNAAAASTRQIHWPTSDRHRLPLLGLSRLVSRHYRYGRQADRDGQHRPPRLYKIPHEASLIFCSPTRFRRHSRLIAKARISSAIRVTTHFLERRFLFRPALRCWF
jgi:hypothetical protein